MPTLSKAVESLPQSFNNSDFHMLVSRRHLGCTSLSLLAGIPARHESHAIICVTVRAARLCYNPMMHGNGASQCYNHMIQSWRQKSAQEQDLVSVVF